jgi:hypothetical protein
VLRLNLRGLGCRWDCGLFLGFQGGLPLAFLDGVDVVGEGPGVLAVVAGEEEADGLVSELLEPLLRCDTACPGWRPGGLESEEVPVLPC